MQASGIIRRVDDLGRIVIPREVRRTLGIVEGAPLEIYFDRKEGSVIFKKYDYLENSRLVIQNARSLLLSDTEISDATREALDNKLREALDILKEAN